MLISAHSNKIITGSLATELAIAQNCFKYCETTTAQGAKNSPLFLTDMTH
jgi:hypothetical protein